MIARKAAGPKVDQLHLAPREGFDYNVLGLDVAVNEVESMDEVQRREDLLRNALQTRQGVVHLEAVLADEAAKLVQVLLQQLADDEEVFLVVEVVDQAQTKVRVGVAARVDVLQQFDLIQGLVEIILVVLDDLQTNTAGSPSKNHMSTRERERANGRLQNGRGGEQKGRLTILPLHSVDLLPNQSTAALY